MMSYFVLFETQDKSKEKSGDMNKNNSQTELNK